METTIRQAKAQGFIHKEWDGKLLKVRVVVHEDWWTKKHTVKKKDISNKEKFLIDCITEGLGLEDSFIWEHTFVKQDVGLKSDKWKSIISIEKWTPKPSAA